MSGFEPSGLFISLADGKQVTVLRAAMSTEAVAYCDRLQQRGILSVVRRGAAQLDLALTARGLALFERVIVRMFAEKRVGAPRRRRSPTSK